MLFHKEALWQSSCWEVSDAGTGLGAGGSQETCGLPRPRSSGAKPGSREPRFHPQWELSAEELEIRMGSPLSLD